MCQPTNAPSLFVGLLTRPRVTCALAITCVTPTLPAQTTYTLIVQGGDPVPDLPGSTFHTFGELGISSDGNIAFLGQLNGTNQDSIWQTTGPLLTHSVLGDGMSIAPGTGDSTFSDLFDPRPADNNYVVFGGNTNGGPTGLWALSGGGVSALQLKGDAAPDIPGAQFGGDLYSPNQDHAVNAAGDLAIVNYLETFVGGVTPANDTGIWKYTNGVGELIVREGDPAPGATRDFHEFSRVAINNNGDIAFQGELAVDHRRGIWVVKNGTIALVALEGDVAPGAGGNTFVSVPYQLNGYGYGYTLNDAGEIAFTALYNSSDTGLWAYYNDTLQLVRLGAGLAAEDGDWIQFSEDPAIDPDGNIVAHASRAVFTDPILSSDTGIAYYEPSTTEMPFIAKSRYPIADPADEYASVYNNFCINHRGDILLFGIVFNPEPPLQVNALLLYHHRSRSITRLVSVGESILLQFPEGGMVTKTVTRLDTTFLYRANSNAEDGLPDLIDRYGQVVVRLEFTDLTAGLVLITPECVVDFDSNGVLNFDDLDAFINAFGDAIVGNADLDGDGDEDLDDLDIFIESFLLGCP